MLLAKIRKTLEENYLQFQEPHSSTKWLANTPALVTKNAKAERIANPYLGVIPGANLYSSVLEAFCAQCNPSYHQTEKTQIGNPRSLPDLATPVNAPLKDHLESLCSKLKLTRDGEAEIEFSSALQTHASLHESHVVQDLKQFIINLSSFLNGCYASKSSHIEPFQKQLILHTFYFLISIKAPENTNQLFETFKEYFGLFNIHSNTLQTFKQKSSVFLIPRRHGKTWIVVAIISMLLTSVENLHVGYVAHQKHVANSVFTEIVNTLYKWFPIKNIDIKKENGTIIYRAEKRRPSTLMCATCFNKNVSMPSSVFGSCR